MCLPEQKHSHFSGWKMISPQKILMYHTHSVFCISVLPYRNWNLKKITFFLYNYWEYRIIHKDFTCGSQKHIKSDQFPHILHGINTKHNSNLLNYEVFIVFVTEDVIKSGWCYSDKNFFSHNLNNTFPYWWREADTNCANFKFKEQWINLLRNRQMVILLISLWRQRIPKK